MTNMGNEVVRADFLTGKEGAPKLTQEEVTYLDELYPLLAPKREEGMVFAQQVSSCRGQRLSDVANLSAGESVVLLRLSLILFLIILHL